MCIRVLSLLLLCLCAVALQRPIRRCPRLLAHRAALEKAPVASSRLAAQVALPPEARRETATSKRAWLAGGLGAALMALAGAAGFQSGLIAMDGAVLGAATYAMSKLVVCIGLGALLAGPGKPLDSTALRSLSRLIYFMFLPMLLMESVASTIVSAGSLKDALPLLALPGFALAQIGCGALIGTLLVKALGWRKSSADSRQLLICSAFGNSGPLPMIIADAFLRTQGDPTMVTTAIGYISLYLLGWSPTFWTVGSLLAEAPRGKEDRIPAPACPRTKKSVVKAAREWLQSPWGKRLVSPPILACTSGFLLGTVPFLKELFLAPNALLSPVTEAVRTIGRGYLPCVLLVLAGSIASRPRAKPAEAGEEGEVALSRWEKRRGDVMDRRRLRKVAAVMLARFCILPLFVFSMLPLATQMGLVAASNKLLQFVILLQCCMPCAQNSVVVLQIIGDKQGASEMGKVIAAIYLLSLLPMTLLVSAAISQVGFL